MIGLWKDIYGVHIYPCLFAYIGWCTTPVAGVAECYCPGVSVAYPRYAATSHLCKPFYSVQPKACGQTAGKKRKPVTQLARQDRAAVTLRLPLARVTRHQALLLLHCLYAFDKGAWILGVGAADLFALAQIADRPCCCCTACTPLTGGHGPRASAGQTCWSWRTLRTSMRARLCCTSWTARW